MSEKRRVQNFPLRLPASIKAAAETAARRDGTTLNQFISSAVAEKLAALETAAWLEERAGRAEPGAIAQLLARQGGEPPQEGDEIPAEIRGRIDW
jgi:hypothetical protein